MGKLNSIETVKVLYVYFITNWDKYLANIHNPNAIKITSADIKEILHEKFPIEYEDRARKSKTVILPWLFTLLMREFIANGFKAEKKVTKKRNGSKSPVLYVYRQ